MRPMLELPESRDLADVLRDLRRAQTHLAVVVDEYGDIQGMVTLNDLLGAILGRIQSLESDETEPLVIERGDGSWLVDGRLAVEGQA